MPAMRWAVVGVSQGAVMRCVENCMMATAMLARSRSLLIKRPAQAQPSACSPSG